MIKYKVQSKIVCLKGIDLMQFRFGFQKLTEKSYYILYLRQISIEGGPKVSKDGVTIGLNFSLLCNDYFLEVLFLVLLNMDINLGEWYLFLMQLN